MPVDATRLDRGVGVEVRIAVAGEVGGEHVPAIAERGPQLLVHVRGLPATVQAHDRMGGEWPPREVVHLAVVDEREATVPALRHVVTRRTGRHRNGGAHAAPMRGGRRVAAHVRANRNDTLSWNMPGASCSRSGIAEPS